MNFKGVGLAIVAVICLGFGLNYIGSSRAEALAAEERVRVLEAERVDLERQVEEAAESYEVLKDSLDQAHDSVAAIRAEARERASDASRSFGDGIEVLRDSLRSYEGLEGILDGIQSDHNIEVQAHQDQIETLEIDKALLWQRVEALDSMWIREQEVNQALRSEIVALNEESNAWERVANTSFLGGLRGAVPYALAGAAIALLIR
jgi:septal ring factor EnvC (AmiA/AmiB activator)